LQSAQLLLINQNSVGMIAQTGQNHFFVSKMADLCYAIDRSTYICYAVKLLFIRKLVIQSQIFFFGWWVPRRPITIHVEISDYSFRWQLSCDVSEYFIDLGITCYTPLVVYFVFVVRNLIRWILIQAMVDSLQKIEIHID